VVEGYQIFLGINATEPYSQTKVNFTPLHYTLETPISTKGHDGTLRTLVRSWGLIDTLLMHHPDSTLLQHTIEEKRNRIALPLLSAELLEYLSVQRKRVVYLISPGCDPVMGDNRAKQRFIYLLFL
jgi:hypothetical protein